MKQISLFIKIKKKKIKFKFNIFYCFALHLKISCAPLFVIKKKMFDLRKCENQKNQKLLVFNINLYRK